MKKTRSIRIAILASLLACSIAHAERPMAVESPLLLPENDWTLSIGMQYRDEARNFGQPPRDWQLDAPRLRFAYGLGGRAEIRIEGDAWRFAEIDGNSVNDAGDWTLSTKIRFGAQDPAARRALAGIFAVKLPNASNEEGLGTDETDVYLGLVGHCRKGKSEWRASAMLGILGDPFQESAQNDVGIFGFGWFHPGPGGSVGVELIAQTGPAETDDPAELRLLWSGGTDKSWQPFASVGIGLNDDADSKNLEIGVRFRHR